MKRRGTLTIGGTLLVLLACASLAVRADQAGAFCLEQGSSGPATMTDASVGIGTDRSNYDRYLTVQITIVNRLSRPVYLFPPREFMYRGCTVFIRRQANGDNEQPLYVPCRHSEGPVLNEEHLQEVPANSSRRYVETLGIASAPMAPGTYRVGFRYSLHPPENVIRSPERDLPDQVLVMSQPFRVCICARCS